MLRAPQWMLRAPQWMLKAPQWMLRDPQWLLRAPRWMLRAQRTVFVLGAFLASVKNWGESSSYVDIYFVLFKRLRKSIDFIGHGQKSNKLARGVWDSSARPGGGLALYLHGCTFVFIYSKEFKYTFGGPVSDADLTVTKSLTSLRWRLESTFEALRCRDMALSSTKLEVNQPPQPLTLRAAHIQVFRSTPFETRNSRAKRSPPGLPLLAVTRLPHKVLQPSVTQVSPRQFRRPHTFRDISRVCEETAIYYYFSSSLPRPWRA
eukprot:64069-Prorocentrum_minimum.AAC.3